jgi:hypothetical protein
MHIVFSPSYRPIIQALRQPPTKHSSFSSTSLPPKLLTSQAWPRSSSFTGPTTIMNPPAAVRQEDASTLSSNDTDPVKLCLSKQKAEAKCPIQEVISQKIWPMWKLFGDSGEDKWHFTHKLFQLMNRTLVRADRS